ncbi:hypothetical protein ILUMI_07461 [Ignelater luminosus]|uniref:CCHC-type domain-containing protein n=1 Tax=Ignelater luminosus TaxID=2038154 RepID=A0A8K0D899_IGNLU|nr:hypothetical protein ILUMI_07461 [Ignelater luminosus]
MLSLSMSSITLEVPGNLTIPDFALNAEEERQTCENKLILLQAEVRICRSIPKDNEYKRLFTRLTHVKDRLDRILDVVRGKEDLMVTLSLIFKELENKISTSSQTAVATSSVADLISFADTPQGTAADDPVGTPPFSPVRQVHFEDDVVMEQPVVENASAAVDFSRSRRLNIFSSTVANVPWVAATSVRYGNYLAINKWNLRYDGDSGLTSFLERLDERRTARAYRSVRDQVKEWDKLVAALRQTFLPCDYEATLWDEIWTQGPDEPVGVYIAVMKNLFRRLPLVPLETTRMWLSQRNRQPYLQAQLALQFITSIAEIIRLCKAAEDTQVRAAKFRNPSSSLKNVLEPDLAYRKSSSGFKISAVGSESSLVASALNQATAVETILSMSCCNCSQPGHLAAQCSAPKRLHCYKCGAPNVTTRTCPKCAGNARRSR